MKTFYLILAAAFLTASVSVPQAKAEVNLVDHEGWKVGLGGFIEFDSFYDTTRSYVETVGNGPVARKATLDGDNGRTQFSLRNSRFFFSVEAPPVDGWKTRGYLETDFLGYDPAPKSSNVGSGAISENAFFTNPTLRIRHAYLSAESESLSVLVGQAWSLFGWQPAYVLSTISVNPVMGTSYQRTPRIGAIKKITFNESNEVQVGISLERPSQRDGKIPNVVAAVRWTDPARKSGYTGPNSDIKAQPMGVVVSGTYRNFSKMTSPGTSFTDQTSVPAYAMAVNALLPILASSDGKNVSNSLTLTGEFTAGRGYGDEFPSWSGGLGQSYATTNANPASSVNLDPGLGGYTTSGDFDLVKLRTFNAQLQYFASERTFATVGYGQLYSSNIANFIPGAGQTLYDRVEAKFVNLGHDFTSHVRVSVEFDQFSTHYADGATNFDNRYMLASYFRF